MFLEPSVINDSYRCSPSCCGYLLHFGGLPWFLCPVASEYLIHPWAQSVSQTLDISPFKRYSSPTENEFYISISQPDITISLFVHSGWNSGWSWWRSHCDRMSACWHKLIFDLIRAKVKGFLLALTVLLYFSGNEHPVMLNSDNESGKHCHCQRVMMLTWTSFTKQHGWSLFPTLDGLWWLITYLLYKLSLASCLMQSDYCKSSSLCHP